MGGCSLRRVSFGGDTAREPPSTSTGNSACVEQLPQLSSSNAPCASGTQQTGTAGVDVIPSSPTGDIVASCVDGGKSVSSKTSTTELQDTNARKRIPETGELAADRGSWGSVFGGGCADIITALIQPCGELFGSTSASSSASTSTTTRGQADSCGALSVPSAKSPHDVGGLFIFGSQHHAPPQLPPQIVQGDGASKILASSHSWEQGGGNIGMSSSPLAAGVSCGVLPSPPQLFPEPHGVAMPQASLFSPTFGVGSSFIQGGCFGQQNSFGSAPIMPSVGAAPAAFGMCMPSGGNLFAQAPSSEAAIAARRKVRAKRRFPCQA